MCDFSLKGRELLIFELYIITVFFNGTPTRHDIHGAKYNEDGGQRKMMRMVTKFNPILSLGIRQKRLL